ncbi:hypothetical protein PSHT_09376 [Puccinia striiformis]|uniref:Importin N-terminal domain-containing protein n=1 Tax=Puccinia striiformis TaxID=27350 RepID=A0A2S4VH23_9BASI|nr:hypothetical protein PSHT_09376 [Puccinia striiformis]
MDPQFVQQLQSCLEQIATPSGTDGIKAATQALNDQFYRSPLAIPGLFEILTTCGTPAVRQLSAVELRKRVSAGKRKHWKKLGSSMRDAIKSRLLEIVVSEPVPITRHAIARVISEVAEYELPEKAWPQLLGFLMKATDSPVAQEREVAIFTLSNLMDTVVDSFAENLPQIYALFAKTLQDPESLEVRVTTVQALGRVAEYIEVDEDASIASFQAMIPQMLVVIGQTLEAGDESAAKKGFDTLETLLIIEVPLINAHFNQVVQFNASVGSNKALDESQRIMALNCLLWTIKFKKSKIASMDLIKPIVDSLITIGAEDEPEDPEDDSVARTAFRCLDALSTSLSPQAVFPALFARIQECFASPDPTLRKAAVMALGVTVEGCSLFIQPHIDQLWPFIDSGLEDSDSRVRRAACTALSCICEMLVDECASRHQTLVPRVSALLNDPACQRNAMTALDGLLEVFDDQTIGLYLNPLMERLGTVVGAIGSAAYAAKGAFEPYFDVCMQHITPFLSLRPKEKNRSSGRRSRHSRYISLCCGQGKIQALLGRMLNIAFEAIDLNSPSLRECSMIFFGTLAKVYESSSDYYRELCPPCLLSVAADAVSELFEYTRTHFLPYLEQSIKSLTPLLAHFYPTTRKAAATTLLSFITMPRNHKSPKFEPGIANIHMPGDVRKLVDLICPKSWCLADDVVSDLCSSLSSVISTVGAGMVAPAYLDETCSLIIAIWKESRLPNSMLISSAPMPLFLGPISRKPSDNSCLAAKYYDPCFSPTDRNNAIGSLAEVINGLGAAVGPFTEQLLPLGLKATKDEDVEVRSNAAFFVGSLAYWTPFDISSQYLGILECLQPLFTVPDDSSREKSERAKDNAAGAIARMILKNKAALPLDQVLPVFFEALPLKQDFAESSKCFEAFHILWLRLTSNTSWPSLPTSFKTLSRRFGGEGNDSIGNPRPIGRTLRQLNTRVPDQLAACGLTKFLS